MKASRYLIAGTVAALLPIAGAMAQSPSRRLRSLRRRAPLSNHSTRTATGRFRKTEAAANADVSAQFSRYDQNGDGFIEKAEVSSANQRPCGRTP